MDYITQAVTANIVAVILLVSLLLSFPKKFRTEKDDMKVFYVMLLVNLFQCLVEPLTLILDGRIFPGAVAITTVLNSLLYIGNIVFASLWATYADLRVGLSRRDFTFFNLLKFLPAVFMVMASIVNLFTPVFFRITEDNFYQRTLNFPITYIITYFYLITGVVISYGFSPRSQKYVFLPAIVFLTPVFLASILQALVYGISALWVGAAIGLTSAYVALLDESQSVDALSGAYTRHHLNAALGQLASQGKTGAQMRGRGGRLVAGIMLDVDNFKAINDRYGHLEGDEALRQVGKLLMSTVNPKGTVYRFAGDEFTIIMRVESQKDVQDMLERIDAAVRTHNVQSDRPYQLSFSAGYALYSPGEPVADFVSRMDEAMYDNKKQKMLRMTETPVDLGDNYQVNPDRNRILIVDDDFINREILKNIFPPQYRIEEAVNGREALEMIPRLADSLCAILTDLEMPEVGGIELLRTLHNSGVTKTIPTFLVTANDEYDIAKRAYELGVVDVINKPVVPFVILRRVQSVLELFHTRESLRATVQGQEKRLQENETTIDILHRNTIEALASAIEFRDIESGEHINRIYGITKYLLRHTEMGQGFSAEEIENMAVGSIMHDVGKIAISDVILNKPGKLTAEEYEIMKKHTVKGGELLEQIARHQSHPSYVYAVDIARHHHERWDGRGYPDGLKGDEITPWSQVASIADVYDALVSPRVYKKAYDPDTAVEMIRTGQCGVFGPKLLECFLKAEPEIRAWYREEAGASIQQELDGDDQPSREVVNAMLLIDAVRSVYDMIFTANLTRNRYTMIDDETFQSNRVHSGAVFDDMANQASQTVPESHREMFTQVLFREPLLEAYAQGRRKLYLEYPELTDDGQLRQVATTVILIEDTRSGDILDITLTRYLDAQET